MYFIEPQLILVFDIDGGVKSATFLSYNESIENTHVYKIFNTVIKTKYSIKTYNVEKNHVLLTQTINETIGYIRGNVLKTPNPILLYSLFNNITFYGKSDKIVFNPFDKSTYGKKISSNEILYVVYQNITKLCIFCVIEGTSIGDLYSYGEYDPDIFPFVDNIINKINEEDNYTLEFDVNIKASQELLVRYDDPNFVNVIQKDNNIINIIKNINNDYYISGNNLIYNLTKNHNINIFFYENDDVPIGQLTNGVLKFFDYNNETVQNLDNSSLSKFIINKNVVFKKISILMNISMTDLLPPLNKSPFFLSYNINNRKNILFDRSKKINIILTKKKIDYISTYIKDINLFKYITFFLIGIQILDDKIEFDAKNVKKGLIYFSRYCQAKRNPERINILSNNYIDSLENIQKDIYVTKEGHHSYLKDKVLYICKDNVFKYIGFNKSILNGWNICYPCCYKKEKYNYPTFIYCVYNKKIETIIDPYLGKSDHYRLLIDFTQIGALNGDLNLIFNSNSQFIKVKKYLTKKNKEVDNYVHTYINSTKSKNSNSKNIISIKYKNNESLIQLNQDGKFHILNKSKEQEPQTSIDVLKNNYAKLKIFDSFILLNLRNRIELAKNYVIYVANFTLKDIENYWDIDDNNIYLIKDNICFSNVLRENYLKGLIKTEDINIYLVIQKKIHELKVINRTPEINLTLSELDSDLKSKIINKLLNISSFKYEISEKDFTLRDNLFFHKNKYLDLTINTKYFLDFKNIYLDYKSVGEYIERFYTPYFDTLQTKHNKKDLIKTWFINNFILLNTNINLNVLANVFLSDEENTNYLMEIIDKSFNFFYLYQNKNFVKI